MGNELQSTSQDTGCDEELARLAKAIAHPARIRILRLLSQGSGCRCSVLFHEIPLAQSTISQHLKVLREAGLIEGEVDLPQICYCTRTDALRRLKELVSTL
jgi:ArsR family transcriptional regulator